MLLAELVVAGVGVLLDLRQVRLGVVARDHGLARALLGDELGGLLEVSRRGQHLRQFARQPGVGPQAVGVPNALVDRVGVRDLGAGLRGLASVALKRVTTSSGSLWVEM